MENDQGYGKSEQRRFASTTVRAISAQSMEKFHKKRFFRCDESNFLTVQYKKHRFGGFSNRLRKVMKNLCQKSSALETPEARAPVCTGPLAYTGATESHFLAQDQADSGLTWALGD